MWDVAVNVLENVNQYKKEPSQLGRKNKLTAFLHRGKTSPTGVLDEYDIKQSDSGASVILNLWGMWSTPSLLLLPGSLWLGVVASDRVLSIGQIWYLNYE